MEKEKELNEVLEVITETIEDLNKSELLVNYLYDETGDLSINLIDCKRVNTTAAIMTDYNNAAIKKMEQIQGKLNRLMEELTIS